MPGIPPAGLSPASAFTETSFEDPLGPPVILADAIDPLTGEFLSLERGLDPVDAAMAFTFSVERSSGAAVVGVGHRMRTLTHVEPGLGVLVESLAAEAARHLTDAGVARLIKVETEPVGDDGAAARVTFANIPARSSSSAVVL